MHVPKSRPEIVEAWNPAKFPVTAFVTAPAPAAAVELDDEAGELATTDAVATDAAEVAYLLSIYVHIVVLA